ncbi:MAG: hypothetical protein U0797_16695 [Gemmataceae bacterium]
MGLDIHAASHLRYLRPIPQGEEFDRLEQEADRQGKCLDDVYFLLSPNHPDWEGHLADLEPGLYEYTAASEQHDFRAGPYSYYNLWREHLSQLALGVDPSVVWEDPERFAGRPFVELIHFTDCDGGIGTRLASKLATDFRAHEAKVAEFAASLEDDEDFINNYRDFTRAFELARKGSSQVLLAA